MKFTRTIKSTKYIFGEVKEENGNLKVHEKGSFVGTPNMGSRTLAKAKEAHGIPKAALLIRRLRRSVPWTLRRSSSIPK